jgi:hypothetical protein
LQSYDYGGIATSPQAAIFGEGRMPEAYMPLPDGRKIPVTIRDRSTASSEQSRTGPVYRTEVHVHGVQDVDSFKRSQTQIISSVYNAQSSQRERRRP